MRHPYSESTAADLSNGSMGCKLWLIVFVQILQLTDITDADYTLTGHSFLGRLVQLLAKVNDMAGSQYI